MRELILNGFHKYIVYEDGRIYAPHIRRFLKPYDNGLGYLAVKLRKCNGKRKQFYVHRLVAMMFIPNTINLPDINHIDGDKSNNHVSNLEWITKSENSKHAFNNGFLKGFVEKYY